MKRYIMAKVFTSLMLLPTLAIPQERPTAQVVLSSAVKPLLGEWNFAVCGPKEFSTFHAQITNDKNGPHQTFSYAMNGPDTVEAMGADSLQFDFRQVTIRDNDDVQYVLTHTYLNPTTKKLTVESEMDENLYNGHLLGTLLTIPDKVADNKDTKSGTDYLLVFATPGTLDQLPAFSEPGLSLCKSMRTLSDDATTQALLDWADGKPSADVPKDSNPFLIQPRVPEIVPAPKGPAK